MRLPNSTRAIIVLGISLASAPRISAQGHRAGMGRRPPPPHSQPVPQPSRTPLEEFERMSPEEQEKALAKLPPERRQRMEERLRNLRSLSPEQRSNLMLQYGRFNELPPARQEAVRNAWKQFGAQPPKQQQAIRKELRRLAGMSPDKRQTRLDSPAFRRKYPSDEQQIIRDMADVLPPE